MLQTYLTNQILIYIIRYEKKPNKLSIIILSIVSVLNIPLLIENQHVLILPCPKCVLGGKYKAYMRYWIQEGICRKMGIDCGLKGARTVHTLCPIDL